MQTGKPDEVARQVRKLRARYPRNLGLELYSVLLEPPLPDLGEAAVRSVAGEFSHRSAVGETLARDLLVKGETLARDALVNILMRKSRFDEAEREVQREIAAARSLAEPARSWYLARAKSISAALASGGGDYQRAGLLLDQVAPGPLRDERWLVVACSVHLETGETDRS